MPTFTTSRRSAGRRAVGRRLPSIAYWLRAGASLLRHLRRREFAREWLSAGLATDGALKAPERWFGTVYPEMIGLPVDMGVVTYRASNVTPLELFLLQAIAQITEPETIFEFGTFDGATTLALARAAPRARVYTIDLPDADPAPGTIAASATETARRRAGAVGETFAQQPERSRITQLWGDSRTFDYGEFAGRVDLVFVDASHEEAFVASDTDQALRMLAPGGVVLWHDYAIVWPGVQRAVDRLVEAGEPVVRLENTCLALLRRDS